MKIGIIGGTAGLGKGLAARLAIAGHEVIIGSRSEERAKSVADELSRLTGKRLEGQANENAATAEVVIVTIPFTGIFETAKTIKKNLTSDAIIVSTIVPLESEIGGRPYYVELSQGSAAEALKSALGEQSTVVSAFTNVSSNALLDLSKPIECDVIVCGELEPSEKVMDIAEDIEDIRAFYGGDLRNSRILERLTALLIALNRYYGSDRTGLRITGIEKKTIKR